MLVLELPDHALSHDVIGQAAKGLGADDVACAGVDELQHLGGEQPALAHFVAVAQIALHQPVKRLKGLGRPEAAMVLHRVDHSPLAFLHVGLEKANHGLFSPFTPVEVHVYLAVEDFEDDEVGEAGHHRLGSLCQQKILQVIVAQGRVLYVNLSHHAHPDFRVAPHRDRIKVADNAVEILLHA
ncbi:hypothetical protein SDC9_197070 [bioreactor metagenome]|uniref:Uncharacterized protein n=1 Tax=bioreactor metagenome TaxID=1076179 RepID=A0A645IG45_9ZZZZ